MRFQFCADSVLINSVDKVISQATHISVFFCKALQKNTDICVACDITLSTEFIRTESAQNWKRIKVDLHKRPTMFIIQG